MEARLDAVCSCGLPFKVARPFALFAALRRGWFVVPRIVRPVVICGELARAHTECCAGRRKVEGRWFAAGIEEISDVGFDVGVVDAMGGCREIVDAMGGCREIGVSGGVCVLFSAVAVPVLSAAMSARAPL
eukprot:521318-Pleurochrysis_carterae.AAC.2